MYSLWISMSWTAQWSDWLMIPLSQWVAPWNSKDMTILGRSPPLTTSQSGKQIGLVFRSHDIYIYIVIWHVYVILCDIIVLWYPMMPFVFLYDFVILHGWRRVDADHSESGEISDFARWLEDIYALKNPSHGHKMRLENLGAWVPWGCHLGRSFVRFQHEKKTDPCDSNTCNSFFTWKKTKVTGGIWTGWGIFTESRPSKSFCPTPNPAFATASVEVRTICLGAPCSVCSNPVCVDEKCSLWRPEFFVRLRPIWSHEDFTVPLW